MKVVLIGECLALFYSSGSCGVQWLSVGSVSVGSVSVLIIAFFFLTK